jgi:hypothetical protein
VVLRAGEVLEEVAERLRRHDAQVEAEAVARDDRRLRVALRRDVDDPLQAREVSVSSAGSVALAMMSRSRNVSLRRRTDPPRDRDRRRQLAQRRDHRLHAGRPRRAGTPSRALGLVRERGEDLLLALRPEPGERPQPLRLGRHLELVERRDAELVPDAGRGLRPEARQLHEEDDLGGTPAFFFVSAWISPISTISTIFSSIVLPMPCSSFRAPVERELRHGARRLAHARGGAAVGDDPERVLPLELEQVGRGRSIWSATTVLGGSSATPAMI